MKLSLKGLRTALENTDRLWGKLKKALREAELKDLTSDQADFRNSLDVRDLEWTKAVVGVMTVLSSGVLEEEEEK